MVHVNQQICLIPKDLQGRPEDLQQQCVGLGFGEIQFFERQ